MVTSYIWQDVAYVTSAETLDWRITMNGTEVASGVSERRPGQEEVTVYPNRIVEDLLYATFPGLLAGDFEVDQGASALFALEDSSGNTLETYRFVLGSEGDVIEGIANDPVDGCADPRQWLFIGGYFPTATQVNISD